LSGDTAGGGRLLIPGIVMPVIDSRPTLEAPDDDPYLWLEEIEHTRVLDWIEAQNAETLRRFSDAGVMADREILKAIFDARTILPFRTDVPGGCSIPGRMLPIREASGA
jgi:hypothetical protein